jgi:hypothetical protein
MTTYVLVQVHAVGIANARPRASWTSSQVQSERPPCSRRAFRADDVCALFQHGRISRLCRLPEWLEGMLRDWAKGCPTRSQVDVAAQMRMRTAASGVSEFFEPRRMRWEEARVVRKRGSVRERRANLDHRVSSRKKSLLSRARQLYSIYTWHSIDDCRPFFAVPTP